MVLEQLDIHMEKNEDEPPSHTIYKNNSKQIIESVKPLEENIGVSRHNLG